MANGAPRPVTALRAVIIDMDDTLYPEHEFLLSGARAVALFMAARTGSSQSSLMRKIDALLSEPEGRTKLFDRLLHRTNCWSESLALTLVHVYRTHQPTIAACSDVPEALATLRGAGLRIALVSDGPATVQRNKFEALGVRAAFDSVVFTDDLPPGNRKPSAVPFQVAANLLGVEAHACVCIADDASKDFIAPRALGMNTVCVRRNLPHPLQPSTAFPPEQSAHFLATDLGAAAQWVLSAASIREEK